MSYSQKTRLGAVALASLCGLVFGAALLNGAERTWKVTPSELKLSGNFDRLQLVVSQTNSSGEISPSSDDLTAQAKYSSSNPAVATISPEGRLLAVGNGEALVRVTLGSEQAELPVEVTDVSEHPQIRFFEQIRPILNKQGCALAACHAAQHGKGGFKLSVFGFEPDKDHIAMVRDSLERRIDRVNPDASLLLQKPSMQTPHGGGKRLEKASVDYDVMKAWIACGAPATAKTEEEVKAIHIFPKRRLGQVGMTQQIRVEAEYPNGRRTDVTHWARFDSLDDGVASVHRDGLVTAVGKGQGAVMVRFEGQADTCLFVIPYGPPAQLVGWENKNFIDEHAANKFRQLGIEPSPVCDDATFLRRAFLDAVGTLPTPAETEAFLASADPKKREQLVDRLLGLTGDPAQDIYNDAYAAWWSLKWSDLLRNNSAGLGEQGMWSMHNWIRESFRVNKPFDKLVRELITARGSLYSNGPANYYRVHRDPPALAEATAQLFLGIRLECAKCHHHPFEKYSQEDYYGMAAFFARVGTKTSEEFGLFGGEQAVVVRDSGEVSHPKKGGAMQPKPLDGEAAVHPLDRRIPLADWLTAKDNSYFAKNVVNRYVSFLLGRGLVEPVDDLRSTNPATNPELLDALCQHLAAHQFDLKQLVRAIMTSRLYQLDSQPTAANAPDKAFYSHYLVKRITAEPLIDAIDHVTGAKTKYKSLPLGTRAIELPDAEYPDYFLAAFGKPKRVSVCECERPLDPSLAQALHTLNGETLMTKIGDKTGRLAKLLAEKKSPEAITTEFYLATLSRPPSPAEIAAAQQIVAEAATPEEGWQDLLWALLNSKQFLFVR